MNLTWMMFLIDDVDDVSSFFTKFDIPIVFHAIYQVLFVERTGLPFFHNKKTHKFNHPTKTRRLNTCIFHLNVQSKPLGIPNNGHRGTPRSDLFCVDVA